MEKKFLSGSNSIDDRNSQTTPLPGDSRFFPSVAAPKPLRGVSRRFGDLRVRPKLMVLHNGFFLALACSVYFAVILLVETRLADAQRREVSLILKAFQSISTGSEPEFAAYELRRGSAADFGLPLQAVEAMAQTPGRYWRRDASAEHIYIPVDSAPGRYWRLTLPLRFYQDLLESLKLALFAVLGLLYAGAVLLLELIIMPRYVYQPLRMMLAADAATREGNRAAEQISEAYIPGDEIGQIMHSRNQTVAELRKREDQLEQALATLEAAKRSLEAQDRLVSLGILSASVAHEINTPLAVLHGSVEKLLETTSDPGARSRLERMLRVTRRLQRISEGLLDFARVRQAEMGPVPLRPLIDEAWHLVGIDEKATEVRFDNLVGDGDVVRGNADRLIQVFVNLIRNALLAVPARTGAIRVTSDRRPLDGKPGIAVVVEDNGPGIPPEVLPDIFEAFVTTRLDARGTGLGLTVAEGIVDQHGGSMAASNCPRGGARLEVLLPAAQENA
jgi:signal transduction histidine kinase